RGQLPRHPRDGARVRRRPARRRARGRDRRDGGAELLPHATRSGLGARRGRRVQQGLHHRAGHPGRLPRRRARRHGPARGLHGRRHLRRRDGALPGGPRRGAADLRVHHLARRARAAPARARAAARRGERRAGHDGRVRAGGDRGDIARRVLLRRERRADPRRGEPRGRDPAAAVTCAPQSPNSRGRVPVPAGRRRSNSSPEPLRHQDRAGETPLESDGHARPPTGKALVPPGRISQAPGDRAGTEGEAERPCPARRLEDPVPDRPTLSELERGTPFVDRHIGPRPAEVDKMLEAVGAASLDELAAAAVPDSIRDREPVRSSLPPAATETEVLAELRALAARNTVTVPMIGLGYSGTVTPAVIRRNVLENPAWYTAYTPYQPEISQGRLEALLTFQ